MALLRGQANVAMSTASAGGDKGRQSHGHKKAPKHRNKLPAWNGPVPQGDDENLRGFPMILTPRA